MEGSSISFDLRPLREHVVAGEPFRVEVTLTNRGEGACEVPDPTHARNWQPTYVLLGEGREQIGSFDLRRGRHGPQLSHPERVEAVCLRLEPGEIWTGIVRLDPAMALSADGRYELIGILDWGGRPAQSDLVAFSFERLRPGGVALGSWGDPPHSSIVALWLHQREAEQQLFECHFRYEPGDDGGVRASDAIAFATLGGDAREPLTQKTAHALQSRFFHWAFYREGSTLVALDSLTREPVRQPLPAGATLVGQPFLDRSGTAELWIYGPGEAQQLRWLDPTRGEAQPEAPVATVSLPDDTTVIATAVDPDNGHHWLAVFALAPGNLRLDLLSVDVPARSWTLPDGLDSALVLAPDTPAVAFVEPSGALRLGLALGDPSEPTRVVLLEARIADEVTWQRTPLKLSAALLGARLEHLARDSGEIRRVWALWTEDGGVHLLDELDFRTVKQDVEPDHPRALVVLESTCLMPVVSPTKGVSLVELR